MGQSMYQMRGLGTLLVVTLTYGCTQQTPIDQPNPFVSNSEILIDDMILDKSQLSRDLSDGSIRISGAGITGVLIWRNGVIPVQFDSSFSESERRAVFDACAIWTQVTGVIRCVSRQAEAGYLQVYKSQPGCFATVGGSEYSAKTMNLQAGSSFCWGQRAIVHELGHVSGLLHEHQHPDRDQFLNVLAGNATVAGTSYFQNNFLMKFDRTLSPYDVFSVMHYALSTFQIPDDLGHTIGSATISMKPGVVPPERLGEVGRAQVPSQGDAVALRTLYGPPSTVVPEYNLTIEIGGNGGGQVRFNNFETLSPRTNRMFVAGTVVQLTPLPNSSSEFAGYSGDADCNDASVTMNSSKTCRIEFRLKAPTVVRAPVIGNIERLFESDGKYFASGWACVRDYDGPIPIHIYLDGPAGVGQHVLTLVADQVDYSDRVVPFHCQTFPHRFTVELTSFRKEQSDRTLWIHGISPHGPNHLLIENSGKLILPRVAPKSPNIERAINCNQTPTNPAIDHRDGNISGDIWGVTFEENKYYLVGWTCKISSVNAIHIHVYTGGMAGVGQFAIPYHTTVEELGPINQVCKTLEGSKHIFKVDITELVLSDRAQGKSLWVHAIDTTGTAANNTTFLPGSGKCLVP